MEDIKEKTAEYQKILKEYKDYIYFRAKTMTEAEYWREKCYGTFDK